MSDNKNFLKNLAIVLAFFLTISIVIGIYKGIGEVARILVNTDNNTGKTEIINYSGNAKVLDVSLSASNLVIKEGNKLKVQNNNKNILVEEKENKLIIKEKNHNILINNKSKTVVYIPKNMIYDMVKIETGAGNVEISNIITKDLELELGAGKLTLNNLTTKRRTKIEGGAGKLSIINSNLNNLSLEAGVGKTNINAVLNGKTKIESGIGALTVNLLGEKDSYLVRVTKGLGSIMVDNEAIKNESVIGNGNNVVEVDGALGSINVNFNER